MVRFGGAGNGNRGERAEMGQNYTFSEHAQLDDMKSGTGFIGLDKSGYQVNSFLISLQKTCCRYS